MKLIRVISALILLILFGVVQATVATTPPEILDRRTESAKFYPAQKGTRGDFFTGPVHYKDTQGKWQDINQNVVDLAGVSDKDDNIKRFDIGTASPSGRLNEEIGIYEDEKGNARLFKNQWQFAVLRNKFGFLAPKRSNGPFVVTLSDKERIVFKPLKTKTSSGKREKNLVTYTEA